MKITNSCACLCGCNIIQICSEITSDRVLDDEFLYTKILEVNLIAFAYRLFHEDFSSINGALQVYPLYNRLRVTLRNAIWHIYCTLLPKNLLYGDDILGLTLNKRIATLRCVKTLKGLRHDFPNFINYYFVF